VRDYTPQVATEKVDGLTLQLVNWLDYKGWEVRLADVSGERVQRPEFLGYIHASGQPCEKQLWHVGTPDSCADSWPYLTRNLALQALLRGDS